MIDIKKCNYSNQFFCKYHLFKCNLCNTNLHKKFKKNNLNICKLCFNKSYPIVNYWKEYLYRPNSKFVTQKLTKRFNDNFNSF